jgi:hypothetical protein
MTPEDGKEEQWWWQWQNVPSRGHMQDKDSVCFAAHLHSALFLKAEHTLPRWG